MVDLNTLNKAIGNTHSGIARLVIAIAIPLAAGLIGALFTADSVGTWYQTIQKPWFTPPNWLFGPAWTVLYVLMGVSLYFVWRRTTTDEIKNGTKSQALAAFGMQLGLNVLWSFLFFGLRSPQMAFAEIVILLAGIIVTVTIFFKISKLASILLLPYAGWVVFASVLNFEIWLMGSS